MTYRAAWVVGIAAAFTSATQALGQSAVVSWGDQVVNSAWNHGPFVSIAAGGTHSLALRSDGSLVAYGNNNSGQCRVPTLPPGLSYGLVSAGADHAAAIRSDSSVVAWGANNWGQCDAPALPVGVTYIAVSTGGEHTLALRSDGVALGFGRNDSGQCDAPALPPGLSYVEVAAGWGHSLFLRSDGSVVATGFDYAGQTVVPAQISGQTCVQIAAGVWHSVARLSDGSIVAWGYNPHGECNVPALPAGVTYVDVAAGAGHTVARRSDGSVIAWGDNSHGQCSVPALPSGSSYVCIAAGGRATFGNWWIGMSDGYTLALRSDGELVSLGSDSAGQRNVPALAPGVRCVELAAGPWHTARRGSDGSIVEWGNSFGPAPTPPLGLSYTGASANGRVDYNAMSGFSWLVSQTLALRSDGSIVAWGDNTFGEGDVPGLPPGRSYMQVAAGAVFSVARRDDGSIVAWGDNGNANNAVPPLPPGRSCVELSAGPLHALARLDDGTVLAWGSTGYGECNVPSLPPGVAYVEVAAGGLLEGGGIYHAFSVARRSDGSVVAWGDNSDGQCNVPTLPLGVTYVGIAAGGSHVAARRSDGSLVVWGNNAFGQCDLPAVPPGHTCAEFACGAYRTLARLEPPVSGWNFCTAGTTTNGCLASISGSGMASASMSSVFTVTVQGVEGLKFGIVFYGLDNIGFAPTHWGSGNSYLCVKTPTQRMGAQNSQGTFNHCDGVLSVDWNSYIATHSNALGVPFAAGQHVCAQAWFRDPPAPKSTNLSNALEFVVQP